MKRFSIIVRELQADHEIELCQCDSHPEAIVAAAQQKMLRMCVDNRKVDVPQYEHVYFRDNEAKADGGKSVATSATRPTGRANRARA